MSLVLETIIARHAEDAAFLWLLRSRAITGTAHCIDKMRALDERVDAHLDGLRVAGEHGWRCCVEQLRRWGEPDEVFVAAYLAFEQAGAQRWSEVLEHAEDPEVERAIVGAAAWHERSFVQPTLVAWASSEEPSLRRIGLSGLAAHRDLSGIDVQQALTSLDPRLVAAAAQAVGALGRIEFAGALSERLDSTELSIRRAAAHALARLGRAGRRVMEVLVELCVSELDGGLEAIKSLVLAAPDLGRQYYSEWSRNDPARAIRAAAILGDIGVMHDLLEWMADDAMARRAAWAFATIVGVDIEDHDLTRGAPSHPDDDDEPCVDPDYGLQWPSSLAVRQFWRQHAHDFRPHVRYLGGRVVDDGAASEATYANLMALCALGRPWWRHLAAARLAQRFPTRPLLETSAPTGRGHELPGRHAWWRGRAREESSAA